jgi:hypothetical protein
MSNHKLIIQNDDRCVFQTKRKLIGAISIFFIFLPFTLFVLMDFMNELKFTWGVGPKIMFWA